MQVKVNEREIEVEEGATVDTVRRLVKADADVLVRNGFPAAASDALCGGDEVVLIRRGEKPSREELEVLLAARHTPGVQGRLKEGKVAIAGLGGLGSAVAVALARCGVGALVLADFDVVEPSNLNRQQYNLDQVGLPKADALKANLAKINPCVEVEAMVVQLTRENVPRLLGGVQVLVEAFDSAEAKAMLIDSALGAMPAVAVVSASGLAGYGPANSIVTREVARNLYIVGDGVTEARPGTGLMAPRVGVAAHHQANAVVRLLLGESPVETAAPPRRNRSEEVE